MSLFRVPQGSPPTPEPNNHIPVEVFDLSKRYDIYCTVRGEDRLYENVRIVGIRTFEKPKGEFGRSIIGGYLEIESENGARMMMQNIHITLICEHGTAPEYTVLRVRNSEY